MANDTVSASAPPKKGKWLKILGFTLGTVVLLVVVLYFVATSSGFFKSVILPRVSKAVGAEITVSDASISPFSEVVLHNLKVQTTGAEPLLTATEVHARYHLREILGGNIHVDEVVLTSPTVTMIENPDGSSNLDPLTKNQKPAESKSGKPQESAKPTKPMQIDIGKVSLTDGTVRQSKTDKDGEKDVIEVSNLNLTLENLKNGQTGKLTVGAGFKEEKTSPKPDESGVLEAKASGEYSFSLTPDLAPASAKGAIQLEISRAEGAFEEVAGGSLALDCEVTPTEIKEFSLHLQKGTKRLGELRVSGPFSAEKMEGKLTVEILSIDRKLLNLAGAKSGIKFGTTTINSTNQIEIAKAGSLITAMGQVDVSKLQMKRMSNSTPTLDMRADYNVTVDLSQSNAVLRQLTIAGAQGSSPLLHGELTSPMRVSWGTAAGEMGDSTFTFTLTDLNLPDWKPFIGDALSSGKISAQAKIISQKGGDLLTFDVGSQASDLSGKFGSNRISQAGLALQVSGQATDLKQFNLTRYSLQVTHQKDAVVTVSGSGTYVKGDKPADCSADLQLDVQAFIVRLLDVAPQPDASLTSGSVELKGHLVQKGESQTITGSFALSDLTGKFGKNEFKSFAATADLDLAMSPDEFQIHKASGKITEGGKAGGSFDVTGSYDFKKSGAQFTARLSEFNENGLRPFLEPMLADKKLVTVALSADASIQYATNAPSAFKGGLQVTKLVVSDPKNEIPAAPLEAKFQYDVSLNKQVLDIRQFQVTLTPTSRGKNEVDLTGKVDMSQTNATQGDLKLTADSLDLTTYYDLFVGDKRAPATQTATAPRASAGSSSSSQASANQEPAAQQLPFRNFSADATIHHMYLREVEVADAHALVKIDGGHVVVNPFKLTLNEAPVNATVDLDMGVPGYKYDISLGADHVPLAPFIDSFQPERKGQLSGTLTANAGFKGQGTTGASLQKNLSGKFEVGTTNLNLSVVNIKDRMLKDLVNVVATIPELVRDPVSGATSLLQGITGLGKGGLTGELQQSPIDAVTVRGDAGSGKINVSQAEVRSVAFLAEAAGTVILAPVLTNSPIQFPISLSLSRPLGDRLGLTPANAPTNTPYVKLPDFVTMKGTVGNPKTDIDKVAVAKLALQSVGGGQGGLLKGLGGFLGGGQNSAAGANTNQSGNKAGSLVQGLSGFLNGGGNSATNSGSNQPAPSGGLFDGFLKKK